MRSIFAARASRLRRAFSSSSAAQAGSRVCLAFTGQGSQYGGMGKELAANFKSAREVFEEADEALKLNLSKIMFHGTDADVKPTQIAQPAVFCVSVAALKSLYQAAGLEKSSIAAVIGHSVGEIAALYCSGSISFTDAVRLARFRGEEMQKCVGSRSIAMAALLPLSEQDAFALVQKSASMNPEEIVDIANVNSPKQVVLSGTQAGVEAAVALAKANYRVKKSVFLDVSCPFHSRIMVPAAKALHQYFSDQIQVKECDIRWFSNLSGKQISSAADIVECFVQSSFSTVRWIDCVTASNELQPKLFVELGPREVLGPLIQQCLPKSKTVFAGSIDGIKAIEL